MRLTRILSGTGAIALVAVSSLFVLASPAHAAPSVTVEPNSDLKGGTVITVTFSGFSPNAPVALGICPTKRVEAGIKGAGDCGPSKKGAAKLTTADASGKGTAQLTVVEGALGNATPPAAKCPPCSVGAQNIALATESANAPLKYASESKSAAPAKTSAAKAPSQAEPEAAVPDDELVTTGPRETLITALIGLALLQLGLVLAVRTHRAGPRRHSI